MKKILPIFIAFAIAMSAIQINAGTNNPPTKPIINGPTEGEPGVTYTYTVVSTDPDGDKIRYCFDWGDGETFCSDYVNSGQTFEAYHAWAEKGTYIIKVYAEDENGAKSETATLQVKMPLAKILSSLKIAKPRNGIYLFGIKVFPMIGQIVIGDVKVIVSASSEIKRVDFLLPMACGCGREIMHTDFSPPFEWEWNQDYDDDEVVDEGFTQITVKGYDAEWNEYSDTITLFKVRI